MIWEQDGLDRIGPVPTRVGTDSWLTGLVKYGPDLSWDGLMVDDPVPVLISSVPT